MEWAIPPKPRDWVLPSQTTRNSGSKSVSSWDPYIWGRSVEPFQTQTFQLTTLTEDSTSVLPLQTAVQRFLRRIYIPSRTFLESEGALPEDVKTILGYYSNNLKTRDVNTYNTTTQWSLKYTGEIQNLDTLRPSTPWDKAYKYYRWNFADPTQCSPPSSSLEGLSKDTPAFDFRFQRLSRDIIYTYRMVEGFQVSLVNTGIKRIQSANQKFKNGVLMVRFDQPTAFDGYAWDAFAPSSGWSIQGSNDDSVWNDDTTTSYMDAMKLDSAKWQLLHKVGGDDLPSSAAQQNVTRQPRGTQGGAFTNKSRSTMTRHFKQATTTMLTLYIQYIRTTYTQLPSALQGRILDCYTDIERDMSDAKNTDLNENQVDTLVQKYIHDPAGQDDITTLATVDISGPAAAAKAAPGDSTKYISMRIPSELPLVPNMMIEVYRQTDMTRLAFRADIYSYVRSSGQITLYKARDFTNVAGAFAGSQNYVLRAYFYDTTTASVVLNPIQEGDLTLTVGTGLSYAAGNNILVSRESRSFEATVISYNRETGAMNVRRIRNIVGDFRDTGVYEVKPLQNACVVRLRDAMVNDLRGNINKIYTFVSGCQSGSVATLDRGNQGITITFQKPSQEGTQAATADTATTITLNPAVDRGILETSNLNAIRDVYTKYTNAYNSLVRINLLKDETAIPESAAVQDASALFEEPDTLTAVTALPDIVLRQLKRMINEKMRYFYNLYHFTTSDRGVIVPVNFTRFYEPALRSLFILDSVTGKSAVTRDYEALWKIQFSNRGTDAEGNEITGKEMLSNMNAKYDALIEALKANKLIAEERKKTIQIMEVFEDFYGRLSSVLTTMTMQLPPKATRDNERLFVAANSNSTEELQALRKKYEAYLEDDTIMQNYASVKNDLWTRAEQALEELVGSVGRLYETADPSPFGGTVRLSEWKRTVASGSSTALAATPFFQELEVAYTIEETNRPSVVYPALSTTLTAMKTKLVDMRSRGVFKKPEAGDMLSSDTKANFENYKSVLEQIGELQNTYIGLFNAKELLDPVKEANKSLGFLTRTRDAMQIDRLKVRVRKLVNYYKKVYEGFVDVGGVNVSPWKRWETLYEQPVIFNPGNTDQFTYILKITDETSASAIQKLQSVAMSSQSVYNPVLMESMQIRATTIASCTTEDLDALVNGGQLLTIPATTEGYLKIETNEIGRLVRELTSQSISYSFIGYSGIDPVTLYDRYKITEPSTSLHSAYEADLATIDGVATDINNIGQLKTTLETMETEYGNAGGRMNILLEYVSNVGIQLCDKPNHMMETDGYRAKITDISGSARLPTTITAMASNLAACSSREADRSFFGDLTGSKKFDISNDSTRQASYVILDQLLVTRGACGEAGGTLANGEITSFAYQTPKLVEKYIQQYTKAFQHVVAYEYQLARVKVVMGRLLVDYLRSVDLLKTPVNGAVLYKTFPTNLVYTHGDAFDDVITLKQAYDKIEIMRGWVNTLMGSVIALGKAFYTSVRYTNNTLYNISGSTRTAKSWYAELTTISADKTSMETAVGTSGYITAFLAYTGSELNISEAYPFELVPYNSLLTIAGTSSFYETNVKDVVSKFQEYYGHMKKIEEAVRVVGAKIVPFKSDADLSGSSNLNNEIAVPTLGYNQVDYLLVGGGGPGGTDHANNRGGGGGGSGHMKASRDGKDFTYTVNNATVDLSNATIKNSTIGNIYDSFANSSAKLNPVIVESDESIKIKVGRGGYNTDGNPVLTESNTVLYKYNSSETKIQQIEAIGGGRGWNGNDKPANTESLAAGGIGANNGGYGVAKDGSSEQGNSFYGGTGGSGRYAGNTSGDNAGGGGGGGIGSGNGGSGSTTYADSRTCGIDNSKGEDYWGAGGGGGAYWSGISARCNNSTGTWQGKPGGHGYAILRLSLNDTFKNAFNFLNTYTASIQGFQNQYPKNPKDIQRKLMAQRLNAVQFVARPQPPTLLQSLFSFFG